MRRLLPILFILFSSHVQGSALADQLLERTKQHIDNKEWEQARSFCERAHGESLIRNYSAGIIRASLYSGWISENTGDFTLAVRDYLEVQSLTERATDSASLKIRSYASVNLGTILRKHEIFDLAVDHFYLGIDAAEKLGNKDQALGILLNIQRTYRNAENYSASVEINQLILASTPRFSTKNMLALNGLGIAHQLQGSYDLAKYYYEKLREEAIAANHASYKAFALHNLGDVFYDQKQYSNAIEYYLLAVEVKNNDPEADAKDKHTSHRDIAKAYAQLGMTNEAFHHARIAEQYVLQIDNCLECEMKVFTVLNDLMVMLGDTAGQNVYAQKLTLASEQYDKEQLEIDYESKQPELREIVNGYYAELRSQQEDEASKKILFSVIAGFVSLILILAAYHVYSRLKVRRILSAELEKLDWD